MNARFTAHAIYELANGGRLEAPNLRRTPYVAKKSNGVRSFGFSTPKKPAGKPSTPARSYYFGDLKKIPGNPNQYARISDRATSQIALDALKQSQPWYTKVTTTPHMKAELAREYGEEKPIDYFSQYK